ERLAFLDLDHLVVELVVRQEPSDRRVVLELRMRVHELAQTRASEMSWCRDSRQIVLERAIQHPIGSARPAARPAAPARAPIQGAQQLGLERNDIVGLPGLLQARSESRSLLRGKESDLLSEDP